MSKRRDRDFLRDILEAAHRIERYTEGMTYEAFLRDTKTQDAVIRNLEIVGEATKNLSAEVREEHHDLPWRGMAGVRDRLIHDYFGINLDVVWQIITNELPQAVGQIERIIDDSAKHQP
jgi:uncharacterized protein with HEPN domain